MRIKQSNYLHESERDTREGKWSTLGTPQMWMSLLEIHRPHCNSTNKTVRQWQHFSFQQTHWKFLLHDKLFNEVATIWLLPLDVCEINYKNVSSKNPVVIKKHADFSIFIQQLFGGSHIVTTWFNNFSHYVHHLISETHMFNFIPNISRVCIFVRWCQNRNIEQWYDTRRTFFDHISLFLCHVLKS